MKARTTGTYLLLALAAIGTIVLFAARGVCAEAVYPVENASLTFRTRVWTRISGLFRGSAAQAENVRLRREVESLALVRGDLERLEAENARLRRALGYVERQPGDWVAAAVLSSGGAAAGSPNVIRVGKGSLAGVRDGAVVAAAGSPNVIRVGKGSLAGVREGAVVAVAGGLVGLVSEVTPHTSAVTLITDRRVKVACEVEAGPGRRMRGILSGGSEELLALRHLTDAGEVPPRARVLTSGRGGVFPKGLEVGTLLDVHTDAEGLAREGEVQPHVDFSALEDVFIRRGE